MAFELIEAAQDRWRAANAPHLVALVRVGAEFVNGTLVERPDEPLNPKQPRDIHPQVLTIAHRREPENLQRRSSRRAMVL